MTLARAAFSILLAWHITGPGPLSGATSAPPEVSSQVGLEQGVESLSAAYDLIQSGRYTAAEEKLRGVDHPLSLRLQLELASRRGDRPLLEGIANRLLTLHQLGRLESAEDIAQAAYAAWQLDQWHLANEIFLEASKKDPVPRSVYVDWGNLYLEKYNAAEAEGIFQDALQAGESKLTPQRSGSELAYLGLARALRDGGKPGADEALARAVEISPESPAVIAFKVQDGISESNWNEAETWLEKGLKLNPESDGLLELKAALHYFQADVKSFEKLEKRLLAVNPSNGRLYETLGDFCIPRRRLEEAIRFYRSAVERNPRLWSARASLGINLLRMGREQEGKQTLETAYASDPFNIWTVNTLRLLDSFENFSRFETASFKVKIESSEAGALRPYVEELLERSLQTLARKYDHTVSDQYLFEMYNNHADFAVRTLGLPGLGALGATFGRVVAMDSPSARPGGKFHWGSTLWHEIAHVVTLSLSHEKVPRWLTEGISMMEERLVDEGWGDFLTPSFVKAYEEGKLLSLADLNSGFERPGSAGQLELSYFQAGWLCDFLAAHYGFDRIRAMLTAFGEEKSLDEVFREVLGQPVEEIDAEFRKEMELTLKPLVEILAPPPEIPVEDPELAGAALRQAVENSPDNYALNLQVGLKMMQEERLDEAVPYLEKAIELFPFTAGEGSPYDFLTTIYEEQGDTERTVDILRRHWKIAPRIYETGIKLARLLLDRGEHQEAVQVLEGLMYVNPLQPEAHLLLGDGYLKEKNGEKAAREFGVLLALKPGDSAGAHYRMAEALLLNGNPEQAKRHTLMALEIAPSYEEAQKLLLRLVRQ